MDAERFGPIDFDLFHREELPARLRTHGPVFTGSDLRVVRPLAFQLTDGRAYTYTPSAGSFTIEPGNAEADTVVELAPEEWCAYVWELRSCFAMLYADQMSVVRGTFGQLVRWEPPLRVAFDGQGIYDIDVPPPVQDREGNPFDLTRTFTLDDPQDEIADFLHGTGFVHLRQVMDEDEVEALRADVDQAVAMARPDDRRSWWTTVGNRAVCNRVNYLNDRSERIADLGGDQRFARIAALSRADLRDARDRLDGNSVVIKVPGAADGLADLPWHRDCGMGGHPVKCPMLNVGIQLDAATDATGQLLMVPGSHRGTSRLPSPKEAARLPVVPLSTEPGDVTVHFGHTLHAAPPPTSTTGPGRRALYVTFVPPITFDMVGPGQGYNDVLFARDGGHVRHVDQLH